MLKNQAHLSTHTAVFPNWSSLATKKQCAPAEMSRILLGLHDGADSLFLPFDLLLIRLKLDVNLKGGLFVIAEMP